MAIEHTIRRAKEDAKIRQSPVIEWANHQQASPVGNGCVALDVGCCGNVGDRHGDDLRGRNESEDVALLADGEGLAVCRSQQHAHGCGTRGIHIESEGEWRNVITDGEGVAGASTRIALDPRSGNALALQRGARRDEYALAARLRLIDDVQGAIRVLARAQHIGERNGLGRRLKRVAGNGASGGRRSGLWCVRVSAVLGTCDQIATVLHGARLWRGSTCATCVGNSGSEVALAGCCEEQDRRHRTKQVLGCHAPPVARPRATLPIKAIKVAKPKFRPPIAARRAEGCAGCVFR